MADISPKAVVLTPAGLADDVRVGAFSFLGPGVTVGAGTVIHNSVTVTGATAIGAACELFPGCVVGAAAEGVGAAEAGACRIGDRNVALNAWRSEAENSVICVLSQPSRFVRASSRP